MAGPPRTEEVGCDPRRQQDEWQGVPVMVRSGLKTLFDECAALRVALAERKSDEDLEQYFYDEKRHVKRMCAELEARLSAKMSERDQGLVEVARARMEESQAVVSARFEARVLAAAKKAASLRAGAAAQEAAEDVEKRAHDAIVDQASKISEKLKEQLGSGLRSFKKKLEDRDGAFDEVVAQQKASSEADRQRFFTIEARRDKEATALRERVLAMEDRLAAAEVRARDAEQRAAQAEANVADMVQQAARDEAQEALALFFQEFKKEPSSANTLFTRAARDWAHVFKESIEVAVSKGVEERAAESDTFLKKRIEEVNAEISKTVESTSSSRDDALTALGARAESLEQRVDEADHKTRENKEQVLMFDRRLGILEKKALCLDEVVEEQRRLLRESFDDFNPKMSRSLFEEIFEEKEEHLVTLTRTEVERLFAAQKNDRHQEMQRSRFLACLGVLQDINGLRSSSSLEKETLVFSSSERKDGAEEAMMVEAMTSALKRTKEGCDAMARETRASLEAALELGLTETKANIDEAEARCKKRADHNVKKVAREVAVALSDVKSAAAADVAKLQEQCAAAQENLIDRAKKEADLLLKVETLGADLRDRVANLETVALPELEKVAGGVFVALPSLQADVEKLKAQIRDECETLKNQLKAAIDEALKHNNIPSRSDDDEERFRRNNEELLGACRADVASQLEGLATDHALFVQRRFSNLRDLVDKESAKLGDRLSETQEKFGRLKDTLKTELKTELLEDKATHIPPRAFDNMPVAEEEEAQRRFFENLDDDEEKMDHHEKSGGTISGLSSESSSTGMEGRILKTQRDLDNVFEVMQATVKSFDEKVPFLEDGLCDLKRLVLSLKDKTDKALATLDRRIHSLEEERTQRHTTLATTDDDDESLPPPQQRTRPPTEDEANDPVSPRPTRPAAFDDTPWTRRRSSEAPTEEEDHHHRRRDDDDDDDDDLLMDDEDDIIAALQLQRERDIHEALRERIRNGRLLSHVTSTLRSIADT